MKNEIKLSTVPLLSVLAVTLTLGAPLAHAAPHEAGDVAQIRPNQSDVAAARIRAASNLWQSCIIPVTNLVVTSAVERLPSTPLPFPMLVCEQPRTSEYGLRFSQIDQEVRMPFYSMELIPSDPTQAHESITGIEALASITPASIRSVAFVTVDSVDRGWRVTRNSVPFTTAWVYTLSVTIFANDSHVVLCHKRFTGDPSTTNKGFPDQRSRIAATEMMFQWLESQRKR